MGGTGDYEIFWSNGVSGTENLNLAAAEYLLFIQDSNGCRLDTSFIIESIVSTVELSDFEVQFSPNPTNEYFEILFPSNFTFESIKIFDTSGRMISSSFIEEVDTGRVLIDVEEFDSGVYLVYVEFDQGFMTNKLIKL